MSALALASQGRFAEWLAERHAGVRVMSAFAFAVVAVSLSDLLVLTLAIATSIGFALALGLPWRLLVRRVLALEGFMLVLVAFLPFSVPGEPLARLGALSLTAEGLHRAGEILLTANAVMLTALSLLGTMDPARLGYGLAWLRVPEALVHLFLFTVRYVGILQDEYARLRRAMRARAFQPGVNRHSWRAFGFLVGMLLVRALERSRRVHDAMKCRGFQGRLHLVQSARWSRADSLTALGTTAFLAGLLLLEHL